MKGCRVFILGAGAAAPETIISNPFLAELSPEFAASAIEERTGMTERRSVLSPEYLRATKNADVAAGLAGSLCTTTDLAVRAADMALARAGISREAIGLVIAECSTARETIPSEAQRIAKALGLKVTAYDIYSSSASFPLAITTLAKWKEERVADYVLFVSTNAPTQRADYRTGEARQFLGDGAAAAVISVRKEGAVRVVHSSFSRGATEGELCVVDLFGHAQLLSDRERCYLEEEVALIKQHRQSPTTCWIGTQLSASYLNRVADRAEVRRDHILEHVTRRGCMLATSQLAILAERWESIAPGSSVLCTHVGSHIGHVVLQKQ